MRRKATFRTKALGDEVPPAAPLVAKGMMHPAGITTLYGESNVGKGWVAAWTIRELLAEGFLPAILDYESVEWEWASRLYGMGIRREHGVNLYSTDEALSERIADDLKEAIGETTHLILDSASAARARVGQSDSGGQDAAMGIFRALKVIAIPSLLIAHRAKAGSPGPIGSVQYRNQSSMVLRAEADGPMATKVWVDDLNDRPRPTEPFVFTRIQLAGGYADVIRGDERKTYEPVMPKIENNNDAVIRIMNKLGRSLSPDDVWRELRRENFHDINGGEPTPEVISSAMRKLAAKGTLEKIGRGRYAIPLPQEELQPTDPTDP